MRHQIAVLFLVGLALSANGACEIGWTAYKDELCIRTFDTLGTYEGAAEICSSQKDDLNRASLVMIKEVDLQNFIANYTQDVSDYVWLGGRYDNQSSQFKWGDGDPLIYANWLESYPRNITNADACIEFRPSEAKKNTNAQGKWVHVTCRKRNLVMCQKSFSWSLQDAVREILNLRKQQEDSREKLDEYKQQQDENIQQLEEYRQQQERDRKLIEDVDARVVPVGSIYIEYHGQDSPPTLWPSLRWQDITSTYTGLFFRAYGGDSDSWGTTQSACAPRITQVHFQKHRDDPIYPNPTSLPASGWSQYVNAGEHWAPSDFITYEGMRFHTQNCEVRPKNKAIKVWKRTS